jgi:hypothetical protein
VIIRRFLGALCATLLVSGSANASTIFAPTDGTVNFLLGNFTPNNTLLAMFDDSDISYTGSSLNIAYPEIVTITSGGSNPGDYTAKNVALESLNLTGSDWFRLAISTDDGTSWSGDTSVTFLGADSYDVNFSDGSVLQVDVTVIPVPSAVWLFGSGLLGLVGIARRKTV